MSSDSSSSAASSPPADKSPSANKTPTWREQVAAGRAAYLQQMDAQELQFLATGKLPEFLQEGNDNEHYFGSQYKVLFSGHPFPRTSGVTSNGIVYSLATRWVWGVTEDAHFLLGIVPLVPKPETHVVHDVEAADVHVEKSPGDSDCTVIGPKCEFTFQQAGCLGMLAAALMVCESRTC